MALTGTQTQRTPNIRDVFYAHTHTPFSPIKAAKTRPLPLTIQDAPKRHRMNRAVQTLHVVTRRFERQLYPGVLPGYNACLRCYGMSGKEPSFEIDVQNTESRRQECCNTRREELRFLDRDGDLICLQPGHWTRARSSSSRLRSMSQTVGWRSHKSWYYGGDPSSVGSIGISRTIPTRTGIRSCLRKARSRWSRLSSTFPRK